MRSYPWKTSGNILIDFCNLSSGAGTISGQGGQDQKRQSLQREIWFFAEIGLLFVPKTSVLSKKKRSSPDLGCLFGPKFSVLYIKKKVFTGLGVFLTQNQQNRIFAGAFFVPNMAQDKSLWGAKVAPGGQLPPTSSAYELKLQFQTLTGERSNI